ncbi:acetyl-CoA carboxylase biotin carboxyl carrier protein subunit [Natroniella sulfidigena]|uniref:acetyl-CoA carboxylase biotin carboxyl carrier protein subunit n=1 Tax=Natroniella sulfidigena TaxID=723921 RepID=UPI00200B670D|nr:acetyl-CoA carboxylase biotin carboxyl carrier protein subunit [Natroniella sulfidigena]MCK8816906.1 acetyl-CoA carboxylase biotin carboxyl carrier protein subunit [Natroniella sulfidigena]
MRKFKVKVNNKEYLVEVEEVERREAENFEEQEIKNEEHEKSNARTEITSPLAGVVNQVLVAEGQQVKSNELIMILEAMKMEHEIRVDNEGVIEAINIVEGATVEAGDILVVVE